jgi:large subunit ribosomal protein L1
MATHSKRYQSAKDTVGVEAHEPSEAVRLARESGTAKFEEGVELHLNTSADPRHADQQLREVAELPHGTGKTVRVFVFAEGEAARAAEEAGADYVVSDELIQRIEGGWSEFDIAIATPDQMGKIGRLGRFLGRKGLMPNPRTGTVVQPQDLPRSIEAARKGRTEVRMDRLANIHTRIGTVKFSDEQLLENLGSVYGTIVRAKPTGVKGQFIKSASLCTTMGPSVKLDVSALDALARER